MASQAAYLQRLDQVDPYALEQVYERIRLSGMTVCPTIVTFKTATHIQDFAFPAPGSSPPW
jgi:hypothetical protein